MTDHLEIPPPFRRALITGITGQDGTYLAEQLTAKGYAVYGTIRRGAARHHNLAFIPPTVTLLDCDVTDLGSCVAAVTAAQPDEVYHLAAQSHVGRSFKEAAATANATGLGTLNMLEAVRIVRKDAAFYFASTSELFGGVSGEPCNEQTRFAPRSPYAIAKLYAHHMAQLYRTAYGMRVSCGILFNHESPRRGEEFVTRKITLGIRRVLSGEAKCLTLGNLDAKRDWGFAGDYTDAMWRMLQQPEPSDFVIGTGETHTIAEFLEACLDELGLDGASIPVKQDPALLRPAEVNVLIADSAKAKRELGWEPVVRFRALVGMMVRADCGTWLRTEAPGVRCDKCKGSGDQADPDDENGISVMDCDACGGRGRILKRPAA